jgi:hypothetical protein
MSPKRRLKAPASPSSPWTLPHPTLVTCWPTGACPCSRRRADRVPCGAGSSDRGQAEDGEAVRQRVDPCAEWILGPRPIGSEDELTEFDSGEPSPDDWLRNLAEPTRRPGLPAACSRAATDTWSGTTHWPPAASSGLEAIWRIGQGVPEPIPGVLLGAAGHHRGPSQTSRHCAVHAGRGHAHQPRTFES